MAYFMSAELHMNHIQNTGKTDERHSNFQGQVVV